MPKEKKLKNTKVDGKKFKVYEKDYFGNSKQFRTLEITSMEQLENLAKNHYEIVINFRENSIECIDC